MTLAGLSLGGRLPGFGWERPIDAATLAEDQGAVLAQPEAAYAPLLSITAKAPVDWEKQ